MPGKISARNSLCYIFFSYSAKFSAYIIILKIGKLTFFVSFKLSGVPATTVKLMLPVVDLASL